MKKILIRFLMGILFFIINSTYILFIIKDGKLWVTGYNGYGELGTGDINNGNVWTLITIH